MKRCPYCAEEIQDDAVICRFCFKRVKGRYNRAIITGIIIAAIGFILYSHRTDIGKFNRGVKSFFSTVCELARSLPKGIQALADYNKRIEYTNQVLDGQLKAVQQE